MAGPTWVNVYDLSESQLTRIDEAEEAMEMLDLSKAEEILNSLREEDPICIPVLNLLAHLHGRYLSDYQKARPHLDRSLGLFESADNSLGLIQSLKTLAQVCYYLGVYEESLTYRQQALAFCREIGDKPE